MSRSKIACPDLCLPALGRWLAKLNLMANVQPGKSHGARAVTKCYLKVGPEIEQCSDVVMQPQMPGILKHGA